MPFTIKRKPKALSYSSVTLFEKNPEEFFLKYLAGNRPDKIPQERPAAAGSGFDACVKSSLAADLGLDTAETTNSYPVLFKAQVEPQNREWAEPVGRHLLDEYQACGAYADLLAILAQASDIKFETNAERMIDGVPMSGKPDCRFTLKPRDTVIRVILDWKVKGYCSKNTTSPSKGYRICRDGTRWKKPSRNNGQAHDLYLATDHNGFEVSAGSMESCNDEYADQLTLYGWLLGEEIGDDNVVVMIDELVAKPNGERPFIRVASHRARVTKAHQQLLLERIKRCWDAIESGHIFRELSREESDARCELLDETATSLKGTGNDFFNECTRPKMW